jgi:hypothetical protein
METTYAAVEADNLGENGQRDLGCLHALLVVARRKKYFGDNLEHDGSVAARAKRLAL